MLGFMDLRRPRVVWRSNVGLVEIAVPQEWEGQSTWNEIDMSQKDVIPTMSYDFDVGF